MSARATVDAFAGHLRHGFPEELPDRRITLYGKLVHASIRGAFASMFPRTTARLDARLDDEVRRFLHERAPSTRYVRDAPIELVRHREAAWRDDASLPPYFHDLVRHDVLVFEVATAADGPAATGADLAVDRPVAFANAFGLATFAFRVHDLAHDDETGVPAREHVALLLHRDAEHDLRTIELSPFAFELFSSLREGLPLGEALAEAARRSSEVLDSSLLERAAPLLADGYERGFLLGAR